MGIRNEIKEIIILINKLKYAWFHFIIYITCFNVLEFVGFEVNIFVVILTLIINLSQLKYDLSIKEKGD